MPQNIVLKNFSTLFFKTVSMNFGKKLEISSNGSCKAVYHNIVYVESKSVNLF